MTGGRGCMMAELDAATESGRLQLLEVCLDPRTIGRLQQLGVAAGWCCLEVTRQWQRRSVPRLPR
jgi:hypothetical protein